MEDLPNIFIWNFKLKTMSNITDIEKLNFYSWTNDGMDENLNGIPSEDVFVLRSDVLKVLQNKVSDANYHSIVCKEHEWTEVEITTTNGTPLYSTVCRKCGISKVSDVTKIEEDLIYRIVENWGNAVHPVSEMVDWMREYASIVNERKDSAGSDTIEFKDWCDKNTWEHEMRDETYYTTKELYKIFQESQPKQKEESEKELEERTERNMNVISDFCEHVKNEIALYIPESTILSFFNA